MEELDVEYHAYFWSSSRRYPFQAGNVGAASDDQIFAVKLRYGQDPARKALGTWGQW